MVNLATVERRLAALEAANRRAEVAEMARQHGLDPVELGRIYDELMVLADQGYTPREASRIYCESHGLDADEIEIEAERFQREEAERG